ncbi:MAG: ABC transporter permease [Rhodobacteraceae bacterium]|nr:ABC transporter permease [Paracoccaceae bacterium]
MTVAATLHRLASLPPAFWGLIAVVIVAALHHPQFLSLPFMMILLRQAAPLGIVALGQTFVVVNRSLDLSVGANIAFVNLVVSHAFWGESPAFAVIAAALAAGTIIGVVNGLLVTLLRASSVVVTLATALVVTGTGFIMTNGAPGNAMPALIKWLGRGRIDIVPVSALVWIALGMISFFILRKLVLGRNIHASGDNPSAARYSGISITWTLFVSHTMCGLYAAIGGILLSGLIGVGALNLGADYVLSSIAAVILGGAVFGGGAGGAIGTMLGTVLLIMVLNLLTVFGVDQPGKLIVQGLVIVVAAIIYQQGRRRD